jgi:WS/DGAT/MGAT family acyltransferase
MRKSMNAMDAGMLAMESAETPMHIGGVQILRLPRGAGRDYVRKLRDRLQSIPVSAPFNYRYAPGGMVPVLPAWEVLSQVDLREHIFHHALPWPGTEKELFELVSRLDSGPLDRAKPLWETHLIEGLVGRRYATFTRIHHALIDGKWGMRLAAATTSPDRDVRGLPPFWAVKVEEKALGPKKPGARAKRGLLEQGRAGLNDGVETLSELGKAVARVAESYWRPTDDGLAPLYLAPACILNGKLTARRELAVVRLSLARIKRLARQHDATINEIVMAVCGGGLRRYLLERKALPKDPLIASMMIAVARAEGAAGGNAIVPGMVSLATHLKDPAKRFDTVRASSRHAKELVRDLALPAALSIYLGVSAIPFALLLMLGQAEKAHVHNLVISNVPGLREKRYVNGALIESEYPMSLLVPGEAMNITVISRANMLDVAVLVCPSLAPHPQRVGEAIGESLDELEQALARKPVRPHPARRRRSGPVARRRRAGPVV